MIIFDQALVKDINLIFQYLYWFRISSALPRVMAIMASADRGIFKLNLNFSG